MENLNNKLGTINYDVLEEDEELYNLDINSEREVNNINSRKEPYVADIYKDENQTEVEMDHERYVAEKKIRADRLKAAAEKIEGTNRDEVRLNTQTALNEIKSARPVKLKKPGFFSYLANSIYHFFTKKNTQTVEDYNDSVEANKRWELEKGNELVKCQERFDKYIDRCDVFERENTRKATMLKGLAYVEDDPKTQYLNTFVAATEKIRNEALVKAADEFNEKREIPGFMPSTGLSDHTKIRAFHDLDRIDILPDDLKVLASKMIAIGTIMSSARMNYFDDKKLSILNKMDEKQMQDYISKEAEKIRNDNDTYHFDKFFTVYRTTMRDLAFSFARGKNDGNAVSFTPAEKTFVNKDGAKTTVPYERYDISGMDCIKAAKFFSYHLAEQKDMHKREVEFKKEREELQKQEANSKKNNEQKIENPVFNK